MVSTAVGRILVKRPLQVTDVDNTSSRQTACTLWQSSMAFSSSTARLMSLTCTVALLLTPVSAQPLHALPMLVPNHGWSVAPNRTL